MRMDEGLDTGPVVATSEWATSGRETAPELEAHAAREGAALLGRTLGPWLAGEIRPEPQAEAGATLTRRLRRADGGLDAGRTAVDLERQVRAQTPWPGSWIETPAGRLTVHRASAAPAAPGDEAGTLVGPADGLALATSDGRLVLDEVQLAGRRRITGAEFRRGHPEIVGVRIDDRVAPAPAAVKP